MEWVKFAFGCLFLLIGLSVFVIEMIGVYKFKYVLNRMHAAAMGDTLGIGSVFLGLIIMNGLNFTSLKMFIVVVFLWFSSPTASHLIAKLVVSTEEDNKEFKRIKKEKKEEK